MKETEIRDRDKMEVSVQKRQQKEKELIGQIVPQAPNHSIFEVNVETLECDYARYNEDVPFVFGDKVPQNKQVLVRPGFAYVSALNKPNAVKKFKNGSNGSRGKGTMKLSAY